MNIDRLICWHVARLWVVSGRDSLQATPQTKNDINEERSFPNRRIETRKIPPKDGINTHLAGQAVGPWQGHVRVSQGTWGVLSRCTSLNEHLMESFWFARHMVKWWTFFYGISHRVHLWGNPSISWQFWLNICTDLTRPRVVVLVDKNV